MGICESGGGSTICSFGPGAMRRNAFNVGVRGTKARSAEMSG